MLSVENRQKLKSLLIKHEGLSQKYYRDLHGNLTIGIGHNLSANGLSIEACMFIFNEDLIYFINKLENYAFFTALDEIRKIAIINMCFNLGLKGLLKFKKMIAALTKKDYVTASNEILNSKWTTQVGQRALTIAEMIKTGLHQD